MTATPKFSDDDVAASDTAIEGVAGYGAGGYECCRKLRAMAT